MEEKGWLKIIGKIHTQILKFIERKRGGGIKNIFWIVPLNALTVPTKQFTTFLWSRLQQLYGIWVNFAIYNWPRWFGWNYSVFRQIRATFRYKTLAYYINIHNNHIIISIINKVFIYDQIINLLVCF